MSKVYKLEKLQLLPVGLADAWDFFSKPSNLATITPAEMAFKVIGHSHRDEMYTGQIIEYRVRPVAGIAVYWMTEITQVKEKEFFIDEQRVGPYSIWHHQHHFKAIEAGVEMTDLVHYKLPLGWLGDIAHSLFVKDKLEQIFSFRYRKAEEIFGKMALVHS